MAQLLSLKAAPVLCNACLRPLHSTSGSRDGVPYLGVVAHSRKSGQGNSEPYFRRHIDMEKVLSPLGIGELPLAAAIRVLTQCRAVPPQRSSNPTHSGRG